MLEAKNISFIQNERQILNEINLKIQKGEVFGLVGESGGGKTTLLKVLSGLLEPTFGEVFLNREKLKGPSSKLIPGHEEIQLVNQDFDLDLFHTVHENILVQIQHLPINERLAFSEELLDLVELQTCKNQQARHISGGEQQRLCIARALAKESKILLLDEPFAHLDAHLRLKIGNYIKALVKVRKTACILVSHDGSEIMQWCQQIGFLNNGVLQRIDSAQNFYFKPESYYEGKFFGELNAVKMHTKNILFRPYEYKAVKENGLELLFKEAVFSGAIWKSYFVTNRKETVILYGAKPLSKLKRIEIKKK